jgi:predicted flap endonuclease-1-like 5' DNA nuclease
MRALIGELGRLNDELASEASALIAADDLTLIAGIDADIAERLRCHGVTSYAAVAAWTAGEITGFRAIFGAHTDCPLGHWVEQAALLAAGAITDHARRAVARRAWIAATPEAAAVGTPAAPDADADQVDGAGDEVEVQDLTLIRGIDADTAGRLVVEGVWRYAEIAAWTAADVAYFAGALGAGDRIAREGWIEQAAVLATGRLTAHAEAIRLGSPRAVIVPVVCNTIQLPALVAPALPPAVVVPSGRPAPRPFLVIGGKPQPRPGRRTAIGSLSSVANFALAASLALLIGSSFTARQHRDAAYSVSVTLDADTSVAYGRLAALDGWDRLD